MNIALVCLGKKPRKTLLLLHLSIKGIGLEMHCFRNSQGGKIYFMNKEHECASLADCRSYRDGALLARTSLQMLIGYGTSVAEAHFSKQIKDQHTDTQIH